MRTGYAAMRFGWMAFVIPFMFVASPTLLLEGAWPLILIDLFTALIGTYFVCAAVVGFLFRRLGFWQRVVLAATGLATLAPHAVFSHGAYLNLAGVTVGIILVAREWLWKRRH